MEHTEEEKERWRLFRSNPLKRNITEEEMNKIKEAINRGDSNRSVVDEFRITMSIITKAKKEIGFARPVGLSNNDHRKNRKLKMKNRD